MMRALLAILLIAPGIAFAQTPDPAKLTADLRAAQDQIAADKVTISQLRANGAAASELAAAQQQNAQLQQALQRLQQAANDRIKSNLSTDKAVLTAISDRYNLCVAQNQKLAGLAGDILHLYETQSFRSILLKSYEPILGFDRVKLENLIQSYDDKIADRQIPAPATGALTP